MSNNVDRSALQSEHIYGSYSTHCWLSCWAQRWLCVRRCQDLSGRRARSDVSRIFHSFFPLFLFSPSLFFFDSQVIEWVSGRNVLEKLLLVHDFKFSISFSSQSWLARARKRVSNQELLKSNLNFFRFVCLRGGEWEKFTLVSKSNVLEKSEKSQTTFQSFKTA